MLADLNVLVLAAGKSTRIVSVAQGLPKPLISIAGRSILEHNLLWLARHGIKSLFINLHFQPEQIKKAIGSGERLGLTVRYSYEPEILGTAGAYKKLEKEFHGTTLVVYGDSIVSFDLHRFLEAHQESGAAATIALFDQHSHQHTGIAGGRVRVDDRNRVVRFEENGGNGGSFGLVNAGVYLLEPRVAALIPKDTFFDFGKDVFPKMLADSQNVSAHLIEKDGYCLGLDRPENYEEGLRLIQTGRVKL